MATQIIIALCEGPHDVSFICKLLKANGFKSNESKKLIDFPPPMGALMSQEVVKTNVEELNIQQIGNNILPKNTLEKDENYVFLYSIGGDGIKVAFRQNILKSIKGFVIEPGEAKRGRETANTLFSIAYLFDADAKGVNVRLGEVEAEIKTIISTLPNATFTVNGQFATCEGIKLGAYIFTGSDNNTGKLEDILMPLLKSGNEVIFDNAETYLDTNFDQTRTFPLKLSIANNVVTENRSARVKDTDFDRQKSIIGITGQVQRSGKPNTVYISDTDYLTLAKINGNQKCQEILAFFNSFI